MTCLLVFLDLVDALSTVCFRLDTATYTFNSPRAISISVAQTHVRITNRHKLS